jgi:hypothetical protein
MIWPIQLLSVFYLPSAGWRQTWGKQFFPYLYFKIHIIAMSIVALEFCQAINKEGHILYPFHFEHYHINFLTIKYSFYQGNLSGQFEVASQNRLCRLLYPLLVMRAIPGQFSVVSSLEKAPAFPPGRIPDVIAQQMFKLFWIIDFKSMEWKQELRIQLK